MFAPFPDTLPVSLGDPELPQAAAPVPPRAQPSVLLVDDDPFMLGMQSRMLRSMGYEMVGAAGSAEAALIRLGRDPRSVDVIICDLNMPGMDGIEFLQKLAHSPYRGSVILLSGEGARIMHTVQKLLDGAQLVILGALEKPAGRNALRELLNCWKPFSTQPTRPALQFSAPEVLEACLQSQLVLHYQPKVDLGTGALDGAEALVRWDHPVHGMVYPDSFIGTAEDGGAIDTLTNWVLQAALMQQASWRRKGMPLKMAINVSMANLRAPDFARRVGLLVQGCCVSPQDITLEVTESCLRSPTPAPLESLVRLRMQRFGLSIDDFGTGHSSLAQLRDIPFTELKVDRGFVHGARHNQLIRPILEGSVGIAKRLGMRSVAEGVETEDDWHLVREVGCDFAQGYFIGRPMPSDKLPEWLEDWQARHAQLAAP